MNWVVVPAHNEEKHIGSVLKEIKKYTKNILVVDDGSKDKTPEIVKKIKGVRLLQLHRNRKKAGATRAACDFLFKKGANSVILIDADGQHEPKDIPRFEKALEGKDIVFGYRVINNNMPFVFRFGNWVINTVSAFLFGIHIRDTQSGFRAFTKEAYKKIRWGVARGYTMESYMVMQAGKHQLKYAQIPIRTIYNDAQKGTTVRDGVGIVLAMCKWRLGL